MKPAGDGNQISSPLVKGVLLGLGLSKSLPEQKGELHVRFEAALQMLRHPDGAVRQARVMHVGVAGSGKLLRVSQTLRACAG